MVIVLLFCVWISFDGWVRSDVGSVFCYLLLCYRFWVYLFLNSLWLYGGCIDVYDYCFCDDCLYDVIGMIYGYCVFICL